MQVVNLTLLGAVIACVSAFPVMFLAYTDGRADTQRAKLLDCAPPTGNSPPAFRCRPVNERSPQKPVLPSPENLPILEIIEEDLEGMTVVEVNDGRLEQRPGQERLVVVEENLPIYNPSFVISVPEDFDHRRPKCPSHEIYVAELDICVNRAEHEHPPGTAPVESDATLPEPHDLTQHHIIAVGYEEREKCPEGQIYVPEVDICSDIHPVVLPPKHTKKKHSMSKEKARRDAH